jgi:hypothetical protein
MRGDSDVHEYFILASESERGIAITCDDHKAALAMRFRLNNWRARQRKLSIPLGEIANMRITVEDNEVFISTGKLLKVRPL